MVLTDRAWKQDVVAERAWVQAIITVSGKSDVVRLHIGIWRALCPDWLRVACRQGGPVLCHASCLRVLQGTHA